MGIHYASIGYTSTPETVQTIPNTGVHPLKFPRTEQHDPWRMHQNAGALLRMPASGLATIQIDVHWSAGTYARKLYVDGDEQAYTGEHDGVRPVQTWTHHTRVRKGEIIAVGISQSSAGPQTVDAARVQVMVDDDIVTPEAVRARVKAGTDPDPIDPPEAPPYVGEGGNQPPYDPEGPDV